MARGQGKISDQLLEYTFAELSQFGLVFLAGLISGEVSVREVLRMLFALVFHALSQPLTEDLGVSGLAVLFLQTSFEFPDTLPRCLQAFLEPLGFQQNLILGLLCVPKSTTSYSTKLVTFQDSRGVCANRVTLHERI